MAPVVLSKPCKNIPVYKDIASQTVLCHMGFLLSHLLPQWFMNGRMRYQRVGVCHQWKLVYNPDCLDGIVFAGSFNDGINIPDARLRKYHGVSEDYTQRRYDIDVLFMLQLTAGYTDDDSFYTIDTSPCYPGYFQLMDKSRPGKRVDLNALYEKFGENIESQSEGTETEFSRHGPAFTEKNQVLDLDFVPTGHCPTWPPEASAWLRRQSSSGWPHPRLKRSIASDGCHFVSKAHSSSDNPATECRFSFIAAERKMLSMLSTAQKQSFIIFKTLVKHALGPDTEISSYCLKTTLFWTLEKIPKMMWDDEIHGLAASFLQLLDTLLHFLIEFYIPQYFIPQNNLIGNIEKTAIKDGIRKLSALRRHPVESLLAYDNLYEFEGMIGDRISENLLETLGQYKYINCKQKTIGQCLKVNFDDTGDYMWQNVRNQCIAGALAAMNSLQLYEVLTGSPVTPMVEFLLEELMLLDDERNRRNMEFLAMLCSVAHLKAVDGTVNRTEQTRVQSMFERRLSKTGGSLHTHVYYGMFLLFCGEEHRAISNFECALNSQDISEINVCEYFNETEHTLDDVLKLLLMDKTMITLPLQILAYYQLVRLYTKYGMPEKARGAVATLEGSCDMRVRYGRNTNHLLLAFAFMYLGDFWNAARAFEADKSVFPTDGNRRGRTSLERANTCRLMAIYYTIHPQHSSSYGANER